MKNTPKTNAYIEGPFQIWTFMDEYKPTYVSVRAVGLRCSFFYTTSLIPWGGFTLVANYQHIDQGF